MLFSSAQNLKRLEITKLMNTDEILDDIEHIRLSSFVYG